MKLKNIIYSLICLTVLSGCQTVPYQGQAREVKRKPQVGGVLSLPSDVRAEDRQVAETKMRSNCGNRPFKILEEGETVVGQTTTQDTSTTNRDRNQQTGSLFGLPYVAGDAGGNDQRSTSRTQNVTDWQISYECVAGKK